MDDCDRLYNASDSSDPIYTYARTCGHRLDDDEASGDCTVRFHTVPSTSDAELQAWSRVAPTGRWMTATGCTARPTAAIRSTPTPVPAGHRLEEAEASGDCLVRYNAIPTRVDRPLQDYLRGCAGDTVGECDAL